MACPKCGQQWPETPGGALQGACPACLLEFAFGGSETPPAAETPAPLTRLGPYTILEPLGSGGMGVVYLARHESLDRTVALKVLNPACARQKGFPERFQREGQVLAALAHPNIVGVYDLGCEAGTYYLAMERVAGQTLRQVLQQGPVPPARAFRLFAQLCDGLQYAHDHGVVHRDIKPENVLVEEGDPIKIADFGIAKWLVENDAALTETGATLGTRCYTAPEQLESNKRIDHRADLYALGVVLYEMLTGDLPLGVFPPPSRKAAVSRDLDAAILAALDKEPSRRPASARAFKEQVLKLAERRPGRRWPAVLAASLLLLAGLVLAVLRPESTTAGKPEASQAAPPPVVADRQVLTGHRGRVWAVAFARDNRYLATASEDRKLHLWRPDTGASIGAWEAYPRGELGYLALAVAPDGRRLATAGGEGTIRIWDIDQRQEVQTLTGHSREVTALAYSPDGAELVSAGHDRSVRTWDTKTGKPRRNLGTFTDPVLAVAFSPDGKRIAAGAMNGSVLLWDAETGAEVGRCGHARRVLSVAFSPDSKFLATGSHERNVKLWDLSTQPFKSAVLADGPEVWSVAFSPDGRLLACGSHDGSVRLWDPATGKLLKRLSGHTAPVAALAFSADGRTLASGSWDQTVILWNRDMVVASDNTQ